MVSAGELLEQYAALKDDVESTQIHYVGHQQEANDGLALMEERRTGMEGIDNVSAQLGQAAAWLGTVAGNFKGDADAISGEITNVEGNAQHVDEIKDTAGGIAQGSVNSATESLLGNLESASSKAGEALGLLGSAQGFVSTLAEQAQGAVAAVEDAIGRLATLASTLDEAKAAFQETAAKHEEIHTTLGASSENITEIMGTI